MRKRQEEQILGVGEWRTDEMGWNQDFGLRQFKYTCPDWQLDIKGERHKFKVLRLNEHRGEERPEDGVLGTPNLK